MKTYAVDLDGTLIEQLSSDEVFSGDLSKVVPIQKTINYVNSLYEEGHRIVIYTARGMGRFNGNSSIIPFLYLENTKKTLDFIKVKYHELVFGKIHYDLLIDDKVMNVKDI